MTSRSPRASSSCRCPGTMRRPGSRSRSTCNRCARMRPGARATSNSSAGSTGSTASSEVKRIVFEASYLVLGSGRCLSGRAGRDAARSAPSAGDHQIQSGAHLDAGECRRHRRRLSLRLWHGGPGRLPIRRAHLPDVEHLQGHARNFAAGQPWLLRFFDQIRFYPVERAGTARIPRRFRAWPRASRHSRTSIVPPAGLPRLPRGQSPTDIAAHKARQQARLRGRARALGGERADRLCRAICRDGARRSRRGAFAAGCVAVASPVRGSVWRIVVRAGAERQGGRYAGAGRVHEDGNAGRRRRSTASWPSCAARRGGR